MKQRHLLVKYDKDLRIHRMFPEARREVNGNVVRFVRESPGMNFISFTLATERQLDRAIHQEVNYFAPFSQPLTWKIYEHDRLPDLHQKLIDNQFVEDPEPAAVMVFDVKSKTLDTRDVPGVEIRHIKEPDGLRDIVEVLNTVYGNDNSWVYRRLGLHLKIPGYLSVYAAYGQDRPVSVAWTYFPDGHFATLFGGSTVVEYRGRGIYTSLLAARLSEINRRGYPFAVVEAGKLSKPIVANLGFEHLTTVWDYEYKQDN